MIETTLEPYLAAGAVLVLLAVVASKVSSRFGVPALLLFLGLGMAAGSEGLVGIDFSNVGLAGDLGVIALAYILYAGGLSTNWRDIRSVLAPGLGLATLGVAITAGIAGTVAAWALDLPLVTGLLLGAIISSTDAAAVFSVLRSRGVSLRGGIRPLLELESGSNDPMAVFLTLALIEIASDEAPGAGALVLSFVQQMGVGAAVGVVLAAATIAGINRLRLEYDGLYPVITLTVVLLTYSVAALLGGSGFLAVYIAGIMVGNAELLHKKSLVRFHDAIAWLCQIGMFLVLGLLVFPSGLLEVGPQALVISLCLVVVARPIAVYLTLAFSRFDLRERTMVAWVGLRGAVPIILATFPLIAGVDGAEGIFDVVFFAVILSVLLQGTTIPLAAKVLKVETPAPPERPYPLEAVSSGHGGAELHELVVAPGAPVDGRSLLELELPEGSLVVLISREGDFVVPQGATRLAGGDKVLVLVEPEDLDRIRRVVEHPRDSTGG